MRAFVPSGNAGDGGCRLCSVAGKAPFAAPGRIVHGAYGGEASSLVCRTGAGAMKAFNFKLEKVLIHKKSVEDERKNQFSRAERQCRDNERTLDEMKKSERSFADNFRAAQSEPMEAKDMILHYNHLVSLEQKITGQFEKVKQLKQQAEVCREQLVAAKKGKRDP